MIEAVNASLASSTVVRSMLTQSETVSSYAANPTQVQQLPQAPYISPYVSMNYTYDKAVLQIRDADSGEVVRQIPSENQLKAYQRAAQVTVQPREETPAEKKAEAKVMSEGVQIGENAKASTEQASASTAAVDQSAVVQTSA